MTTQSDSFSLSAYLQRIGYTDKPQATLPCLKRLHRLHQENIPFENLSVLQNKPISLELADITEKLVNQKRGGYCFEQNSLFAAALKEIGFKVTPYLSRVRWMAPENHTTPLSHMVLRVETTSGPQLADVGFGGIGLVEPIDFIEKNEQHNDFEPRRLLTKNGYTHHQVKIEDQWKDVYHIQSTPAPQIDLEVGNWYSCTHPKAHFKNTLIVSKLTTTGRIIISNTELIQRNWSGSTTRTEIKDKNELLSLLQTHFNLSYSKQDETPDLF